MMKRCSRCGEDKPIDQFCKDKTRTDGLFPQCKECKSEGKQRYYQTHREQVDAKTREWCEANRDQRLAIQKKYRDTHRRQISESYQRRKNADPEHFREIKRRSYRKNRRVILIREKLYREANRELVRERNRRHYRKNRLAVLMKQRVWYEQNREIHAERVRRWGQNNREKRLSYTHRRRVRRLQNGGSYTKREWDELKRRFDFTCLCCGQKEPAIKLTVDHVIPISRGGTNDIGNIQPLCRRCNQSKGTQTIDYRERIINECVGSIRD